MLFDSAFSRLAQYETDKLKINVEDEVIAKTKLNIQFKWANVKLKLQLTVKVEVNVTPKVW